MGLHRCFEVVEVSLHRSSMELNSLLGGSVMMEDLRGGFGHVGRDALSGEVLLFSNSVRVAIAMGIGGGW
jgi:hypothetical protein